MLGIEGDYAFYKKSSTVGGLLGCSTAACQGGPDSTVNFPIVPGNDSTTVTNKDDFSLRLRAGFLVTPDILLYGTGGLAFQRVEATMICNQKTSPACTGSVPTVSQTDGAWLPGWTVGGGLEWKLAQMGLPNWLIRGEYRYSDFGTWKPNFFVNGITNAEFFADVKVKSQIATVGIAYMFPIGK